jgi:rhamnosyltransferase
VIILSVVDKKNSLAFGFVLYNPEQSSYARIRLLNDLGYKIYIYDNSPDTCNIGLDCRDLSNVDYTTAGKNLGLGVALSTICAQAYYDSYENILFFDQDTIFSTETISFVHKFIDEDLEKIRNKYISITFDSTNNDVENDSQSCEILDVDLVINSGSLFVLENLKNIGWHNEKYYVDVVDYEMCVRANAKGFKVGKCSNTPGFDHVTEQPDTVYKILGVKFILRRYPMSRVFDIIKSSLKLIFFSIISGQFRSARIIGRSLLISIVGLTLSIIILKKEKYEM